MIIIIIVRYLTENLVNNMPELRKYVDKKTRTLWVQILKVMHKVVQSASLCFEALSKLLKSLGFEPSPNDECVIMKEHKDGLTIIIMYVDNILILSDKDELLQGLSMFFGC